MDSGMESTCKLWRSSICETSDNAASARAVEAATPCDVAFAARFHVKSNTTSFF